MKSVLNSISFTNLTKTNNGFKGARSCICLILTNRKYSFQCTSLNAMGLSDHCHMVYMMLKTKFINTEPKLIKYHCYKNFSLDIFKDDLTVNLING